MCTNYDAMIYFIRIRTIVDFAFMATLSRDLYSIQIVTNVPTKAMKTTTTMKKDEEKNINNETVCITFHVYNRAQECERTEKR